VRIQTRKTQPTSQHWYRNGLLHRADLDAKTHNLLPAIQTTGFGAVVACYLEGICVSRTIYEYLDRYGASS